MSTPTPDEEARVARIAKAQELRRQLAELPLTAFRAYVDAIPEDTDELIAARREAEAGATSFQRKEELARARELLAIGTHEAGGAPIAPRRITTSSEYKVVDSRDMRRVIRLGERADDHALAIVLGDLIPPETSAVLRLPSLDAEFRRTSGAH